jgi:hypothetical protein
MHLSAYIELKLPRDGMSDRAIRNLATRQLKKILGRELVPGVRIDSFECDGIWGEPTTLLTGFGQSARLPHPAPEPFGVVRLFKVGLSASPAQGGQWGRLLDDVFGTYRVAAGKSELRVIVCGHGVAMGGGRTLEKIAA